MSRWSRYEEGFKEEIERASAPMAKEAEGQNAHRQRAETVSAALDTINSTLSNGILSLQSETFRREQEELGAERVHRRRDTIHTVTKVIGIAAVLAIAAAVLVAAFQGAEIRKQLAAMSGQMAGLAQAQALDDRLEQRAFVSAKKLEISEGSLGIQGKVGRGTGILSGFWIIPVIENSGSTPTRNLSYRAIATCAMSQAIRPAQLIRCDPKWPNGMPNDPAEETAPATRAMLASHASMALGGVGVSADTLKHATNGASIYVYGAIQYQDVFPDTHSHLTEYCYQVYADVTRGGYAIPRYAMCPFWNCADDECEASRNDYANLKSQVAHHK